MSFLKQNKENIMRQYIKLLIDSHNDDKTILKIQNLYKYIAQKHKGVLDINKLKKMDFLPTIAYYYKCDRDSSVEKLKHASEEEKKKLTDIISTYNLFLSELENLMLEEQAMISRQNKRRKLEKFLTTEEIDSIKRNINVMKEDKMIDLIDTLIESIESLECQEKTKEVLTYFLSKNIVTLFERKPLPLNEIRIIKSIGKTEDYSTVPYKEITQNTFSIFTKDMYGEICIEKKETILQITGEANSNRFTITIENGEINNRIMKLSNSNYVEEFQTVHFRNYFYATYQKKEKINNKDFYSSPIYQLRPLNFRKSIYSVFWVKKSNEYEKIQVSKEEIKKVLRKAMQSYLNGKDDFSDTISVPFSYSTLGINASLEDIFSALEKKVEPIELKEDNKKETKRNRVRKSIFK